MHHAIADGWSMGILIRELWALYPCACWVSHLRFPSSRSSTSITRSGSGAGSPGNDPRERSSINWTKKQLKAACPSSSYPATARDRPPRASTAASGRQRCQRRRLRPFERPVGTEARRSTRRCWQRFRFSSTATRGKNDFAVGTPIAGPPRPELEELIGLFVNTLRHARRLFG